MPIFVFCVDVPDSKNPKGFKSIRISIPAENQLDAVAFFEEHFALYLSYWWLVYRY